MHTGIISFCDRVAYNIKSSDTKDVILNDLETRFQIKILQKHWYPLTKESLQHIYRAPHFACLRSNGNPYYMYLTKYEDVPIIFFIDKKVQPGYQKPRIILGKGKFKESLFSNTLMEGEMVKDTKGNWIFLVNDLIAYENEFLQQKHLPKRLEILVNLFTTQYTPDALMDGCIYQVKQYAYATRDGLDALLQLKDQLPYTNRGIYYWPFFLQYKPKLHNFDDTMIKDVVRKVKDNPEFREKMEHSPPPAQVQTPHVAVTVAPNVSTEGVQIMWLRKTENPDVYDIFTTEQAKSKVGVAHIPSLQASKMLRSVFKDVTVAMSIAFQCEYNKTFEKWVPIKLHATEK
jgi:hypothetical protein